MDPETYLRVPYVHADVADCARYDVPRPLFNPLEADVLYLPYGDITNSYRTSHFGRKEGRCAEVTANHKLQQGAIVVIVQRIISQNKKGNARTFMGHVAPLLYKKQNANEG